MLAISFPHLNGYTVRSRRILEVQAASGDSPIAVTSPFYPGNPATITDQVIGGVHHFRAPHPVDAAEPLSASERTVACLYRIRHSRRFRMLFGEEPNREGVSGAEEAARPGPGGAGSAAVGGGLGGRVVRRAALLLRRSAARIGFVDRLRFAVERFEEGCLLRRFERAIRRLAGAEGVTLIHAHSPFRCALPAIRAGRALGLPVVYEMRGVWEESAVASGLFARGDRRYRHWRRAEDAALAAADAVVCICEELRQEVLRRGVRQEKVFVVPNAADLPHHAEASPESQSGGAAAASAGGQAREQATTLTVGYVGSVRALEGVDELARGVAELVRRGYDARLLVVGGGTELDELRRLVDELGLGPRAELTGPVPHDQVWSRYQRIDIFAITRPDTPVTRLVTPLKPLEAMAMGRALVVSDLPALREIVTDGETGLLYTPGDVGQLADCCARLIADPGLRGRLAAAARRWVSEHRTWPAVLAELPRIYAAAASAQAHRHPAP